MQHWSIETKSIFDILRSFFPLYILASKSKPKPDKMTNKGKLINLNGTSKELTEGIPQAGTFEGIPRIAQIAGPSAGPYVAFNSPYQFSIADRRIDA
jgi:hypothetical protein